VDEKRTKKIIREIIEEWNSGDFKRRKYARSKLRLSGWFMPIKTYNYIAQKMGEELLSNTNKKYIKIEQIEKRDILKEAKKIFGGKIIE